MNLSPLLGRLERMRTMEFVEHPFIEHCKRILHSVFTEEPLVPRRTHRLAGSGTLHVNGRLIMTTEEHGVGGTPDLTTGEVDSMMHKPGSFIAVIIFNTPYATYVHESQEYTYHSPGSGSFWLSSKLARLGEFDTQFEFDLRAEFQGTWKRQGMRGITRYDIRR